MLVTETELKNDPEKYLALSATEDVLITRDDRVVAKLTNPNQDRIQNAKSLFGILSADADDKQNQAYDILYDMYFDEFEDADMDEEQSKVSRKMDKRGADIAPD
mgnify:FL=1